VVTGETGTGKELVARALHERSPRSGGPYVAVNCSAIAEELLESELFGHEKGAFTGAVRTHKGRFERADGGTLFLDEIGDMPLHTQSRLLRALEEGRIERVGAEAERKVDVRVVAATNVPLEQAVGQGRFRADLYHRLNVLRIHVPPLRERPEDIPALVDHFLQVFSRKYGRRIERLTAEALALLQAYLWPGNVRELRNVLERVFVETQGEVVGARAFAEWVRERQDFSPGRWGVEAAEIIRSESIIPPYPLATAQRLLAAEPSTFMEAELVASGKPARRSTRPLELDAEEIGKAYRAAGGNLAGAARLLGVHRATLYRYLEKLRLRREDLEAAGND
jgi:DNA-binding NtrC family response regulator